MTRKFFAQVDRYALNATEGATTRAVHADLNTPDGRIEFGVALIVGQRVRLVIATHDAIRIATTIADIASAQSERSS